MDAKEFLKPTTGKLALFVLLMGGLNYLWISGTHVMDARILVGLPLGFWPVGSFDNTIGGMPPIVEFSPVNFAIDVVFWYLISCGIMYAYNARSRAAAQKADPVNKVKEVQNAVMG